jgi:hypothetical protein
MRARGIGGEFGVLHGSLRRTHMKLQCFLGNLSNVTLELFVELSVEYGCLRAEFCAVPCGLYEEGKGERDCYDNNTER